MQEKCKLKETHKTVSGEYTFHEQKRVEEQNFNSALTNYLRNGEKKLLTVFL